MDLFKKHIFKISFLMLYLAQNCFGFSLTRQQKLCADEIRKVFKVNSSNAKSRNAYALQAYLHFRIPKATNGYAASTFINEENGSEYKHAKAYYEHILVPGNVRAGRYAKLPEEFCRNVDPSFQFDGRKRKRSKTGAPCEETSNPKRTYRGENPNLEIYEICMSELLYNGIAITGTEIEVILSIIENVVIDMVNPSDNYTLDFIEKNKKGVQCDLRPGNAPMQLPDKFCSEMYPTQLKFNSNQL